MEASNRQINVETYLHMHGYIGKDRVVKPVFSHCKREIYKPITNSMNNSGHLLQNIHIAEWNMYTARVN